MGELEDLQRHKPVTSRGDARGEVSGPREFGDLPDDRYVHSWELNIVDENKLICERGTFLIYQGGDVEYEQLVPTIGGEPVFNSFFDKDSDLGQIALTGTDPLFVYCVVTGAWEGDSWAATSAEIVVFTETERNDLEDDETTKHLYIGDCIYEDGGWYAWCHWRSDIPISYGRGTGRLERLVGQVRQDELGGWEYRVTEGTIEETGSNNSLSVSKAWAPSPPTKTYVWIEIYYSDTPAAGGWHKPMSNAVFQTGPAWGVGGTGIRILRLFAIQNGDITNISWEDDYSWCIPVTAGSDSEEIEGYVKIVAPPSGDGNCIGLQPFRINYTVDFGLQDLTIVETEIGTIEEVKKCDGSPT